jgi:LPXTG-motif cell wall-anchored protein
MGLNAYNRSFGRIETATRVLEELSRRGRSDAVLIAAPFLFDRSQRLPGDPGETPLSFHASIIILCGRWDVLSWHRQPLKSYDSEEERVQVCRWWIAHAQDFGAEPPSSEYSTFEEVRELTLAARSRPGDHRFEPVPSPPDLYDTVPGKPVFWNWDVKSRSWQKYTVELPQTGKAAWIWIGSGAAILAIACGFLVWQRSRQRSTRLAS